MLKEKEILAKIQDLKAKKKVKITIQGVYDVEYLNISEILEEMRGYGSAEITEFEIVEADDAK
jgi:hypothetical protein